MALACAFILKRFELSSARDELSGAIAFNGQIYEITIIIMSAYLAYLIAEVLPFCKVLHTMSKLMGQVKCERRRQTDNRLQVGVNEIRPAAAVMYKLKTRSKAELVSFQDSLRC